MRLQCFFDVIIRTSKQGNGKNKNNDDWGEDFRDVFEFHSQMEKGQNINVSSAPQISCEHQKIEIAAVSTPISAKKASICSVFKVDYETKQKMHQILGFRRKILRTTFPTLKKLF